MEGEPKKEMYDLLPDHLYPPTFTVLPSEPFDLVRQKLLDSGIAFPFIVKPEIGGQGILLRKINNWNEFEEYHKKNPVEYMVQSFVSYPMEVSIFYYRYPGRLKGTITGFLHKVPLHVTGNGKDTLEELISRHPKASLRMAELVSIHGSNFNKIPEVGEKYMLSYAANHNRGAQFIDLKHEIDDKLITLIDTISHKVDDFFYGRYDIMCSCVEDLKNGLNFTILEYNGCGAEPNHFYDTGYTLLGAYKEILKHWKILYEISRYNKMKGIQYWSFTRGFSFLKATKKHYKIIRDADSFV